jgi:hypothetical protein
MRGVVDALHAVTILSGSRESFKVWLRVRVEAGNDDYRAFALDFRLAEPPARIPDWRGARSLG